MGSTFFLVVINATRGMLLHYLGVYSEIIFDKQYAIDLYILDSEENKFGCLSGYFIVNM